MLAGGCYQESSRESGFGLEQTPSEPTTQPTTEPSDEPVAVAEEPVASEPAETPSGPAAPPSAPVTTQKKPATQEAEPRTVRAIIETNLGHMEAELWPEVAPKTVENFVRLAKAGVYDNLTCQRLIPGFIVQLGEVTDPAKKRLLEPIEGEFSTEHEHEHGILSMARRPSDPDSATSQFFICLKPKNDIQRRALANLDNEYAIFGKVVRGLSVLERIEAVPVEKQQRGNQKTERSKPTEPILLRTVRIVD